MSNSVDLIIGKEAIAQVENLISQLTLADKQILKVSASALAASKSVSSISSPSGLNESTTANAQLSAELQKQTVVIRGLQTQLQSLAVAKQAVATQGINLSKSVRAQTTATREQAVASQILRAETDRNVRANTLLAGAYARASAQLLILKKEAKDAAIAFGENSKQAITAAKAAGDLDARIKSADKSVGDFQRNVGNYSSGVVGGFKSMFSGIRQLAYILPGLGIAGIFNIIFDAIGGLLTKLDLFKSKMTQTAQSIDTLNKSLDDSSVKDAAKNVEELTINIDLAKKGFLDKDQVINQYNETIGKTTGLVSSLDEAEKELTANGDAYIRMTLYKAAANLALEDAAKQSLEAEKSRLKSLKEFSSISDEISASAKGTTGLGDAMSPEEYKALQEKKTKSQQKRKSDEIKINEDAANQNINIAKKFQEDAAKIAKDFDFNLFGDTKKAKENKTKQEKVKREDLEHLQSYVKPVGTIVDEINKEINRLTTEKILANAEELPAVTFQLEQLIKLKQQLNALPTAGVLPDHFVRPTEEQTDKLKTDYKETFNEIAGLAQKGASIIADFNDMNFKNEYSRLSDQKDIAIKFAGESAEARLKIEADYEKRRKEIANRENKAKQKQAIFNIAIDTAQAIMNTVGKAGFAGLPMALILGAMGAAQIAMVAAQKIPEYFEGGTHKGGLMLVNDAKGSNYKETIVTPDGRIMQPTDRNVLMDAPSGTQIYTPEQWHEKQLFEMMQGKGISMTNNYAKSNGLTYEQMDAIIGKHFANITTNTTILDKNGFQSFSSKRGSITIQNNNRSQGIGFSV